MPKYEELKAFRKQNLIPEYNDSSSEKTMLHREARALAISRLEESARTEEEFANVISWWDKLDDNRERRERYHEIGRSEVPLEWHASDYILPGNANYDMVNFSYLIRTKIPCLPPTPMSRQGISTSVPWISAKMPVVTLS